MSNRLQKSICSAAALIAALVLTPTVSVADHKTDIGYNALLAEYGPDIPHGADVVVSLVEADADNNDNNSIHQFLPTNGADVHWSLVGVEFTIESSVSSPQYSEHSRNMSRWFFGNDLGIATQVTEAHVYEANDFLNSVLGVNASGAAIPQQPVYKVLNHSWVGEYNSASDNIEALRRLDYFIDTYDVLTSTGISNGSSNSHIELLAQSYNTIAVGRTDGGHSRGLSNLSGYGAGRIIPHIVAPPTSTSAATASVSSAVAMLTQSAYDTALFPNADPQAANSETMKAILLAGATKDEFASWDNTPDDQPLDLVYGAGELNVLNSFRIQQGGQQEATASQGGPDAGPYGWDYGDIAASGSAFYEIEVPQFTTGSELSAILTWNAEVEFNGSNLSHSLADLDLRLYDSTGSPFETLLVSSASRVDNIEHVYIEGLEEGSYTLQVISASGAVDFGLAWRLELELPHRATGDYNEDGIVDSLDYALWRTDLGSTTNLNADGNLNGVVDQADYELWLTSYGAVAPLPDAAQLSLAAAAPEPSTTFLLAALLGCGLAARRR